MSEDKLPIGEDVSELYQDKALKRLEFEHREKQWIFEYSLPNWNDQLEEITNNSAYDEFGSYRFNAKGYYTGMLARMLKKYPAGLILSETGMAGLDPRVGQLLIGIVPAPVLGVTPEQKKASKG